MIFLLQTNMIDNFKSSFKSSTPTENWKWYGYNDLKKTYYLKLMKLLATI